MDFISRQIQQKKRADELLVIAKNANDSTEQAYKRLVDANKATKEAEIAKQQADQNFQSTLAIQQSQKFESLKNDANTIAVVTCPDDKLRQMMSIANQHRDSIKMRAAIDSIKYKCSHLKK